jgi:hypothetical protein
MDALVEAICADPAPECPEVIPIQLRLGREAGSLLRLNERYQDAGLRIFSGSYTLTLPAPSVVGRQVDEAGHRALYRLYGGWLAALISTTYGRHEGDVAAAVAEHLAAHGLRPPAAPVAPMLVAGPPSAPPPLPFPEQDVLMLCDGYAPPRLVRFRPADNRWLEEAPLATPEGASGAFATTWANLMPLTDERSALVQLFVRSETSSPFMVEESRTLLWTEGESGYLGPGGAADNFLPAAYQPGGALAGRRLLFFRQGEEGLSAPMWLDVDACVVGECRPQEAEGLPIWSPDGRRTLLHEIGDGSLGFGGEWPARLHLGDGEARRLADLGPAYPAFWADAQTVVLVRPGGAPGAGLEAAQVLTGRAEQLLSDPGALEVAFDGADLLATVPARDRPETATIAQIVRHPRQSGLWFVELSGEGPGFGASTYLLAYDRTADALTLLAELPGRQAIGPLEVTANGRYLALLVVPVQPPESSFYGAPELIALDLAAGSDGRQSSAPATYSLAAGGYDWSADGEWLLLAQGRVLTLALPGAGYAWQVEHDLEGCHSGAWVTP